MRTQGIVKWFNEGKGYGFLIVPPSNKDIFVHYSYLEGTGYLFLKEGEQVEFDLIDGPKGPQAMKVKKLDSSSHE